MTTATVAIQAAVPMQADRWVKATTGTALAVIPERGNASGHAGVGA
jgi:hypothetical protein